VAGVIISLFALVTVCTSHSESRAAQHTNCKWSRFAYLCCFTY